MKVNLIIAWIIAAILTILFLYSAAGKLFIHPEQMDQINLGNWRLIIAAGEIISSLLFFIPYTNRFGTLLLSSYMGGAIIIHMVGKTSIVFPSIVLIFIWIVFYLRHPNFLKYGEKII